VVCDVGAPIRIGWVGVHDPSELLKKLLQLGAATAADVPANAANAQPITIAADNPGLIDNYSPQSRIVSVRECYSLTMKLMRTGRFWAGR
jgi:hypothetical protein